MQQIERVGVVALLFLIVTIVVVAFWDDGQRAESTRVAERDARRDQPSAVERVRADERGLRDDGWVAARQDRERLTAPVGGSDEGIPRPRTDVPDADRADRIARTAQARLARQAERGRAANDVVALELPRGRNRAEEDRVLQRGYAHTPADPGPSAQPASRKQKPQNAPAETGSGGVWVVKSGETLERIARRALNDGRRWPEIARMNGIENPAKILVGQKLQIPSGAAPEPKPEQVATADVPAAATPEVGGEYIVQKGDMLSVIAQRQLGSAKRWREIAALNPKVNPDRLMVGARLIMPVGAVVPSQPVRSRRVARADDPGYRVR